MTGLIALGAGVAVVTGIGAGIGIGLATSKAVEAMQDSPRQRARSAKTFFSDAPLPKVLLFLVL